MNKLKLNKLKIYSKGIPVYDENFHYGLNIIRGHNSSGKSTIIEFIYFVLGGDNSVWKREAEECDFVIAELIINTNTITIKREITNSTRQPMYIFWDNIINAEKSAIEGWKKFPFQRTSNKESFSQVIFRGLNIPPVAGDGTSTITLHQLLRIIYVDQLSPPDRLMRPENQFDTQIIREAVYRTLLGAYDNTIFQDELTLRSKRKEFESIKRDIKNIKFLISGDNGNINKEEIIMKSREYLHDLEKVEGMIEKLNVQWEKETEIEIDTSVIDELNITQNALNENLLKLKDLQIDIIDSKRFIIDLENRLNSIDDSISVRNFLGRVQLEYCPSCLSPLSEEVCSPINNLTSSPLSRAARIS